MTWLWVAAAKSLQSCPTLCNPIDGSPPGSSVPGILQARTLEWVAISFSNAWKWKVKVKSLSRVRLLETPWTAAYRAPPSVGFSRQECWSGVPLTMGRALKNSGQSFKKWSCFREGVAHWFTMLLMRGESPSRTTSPPPRSLQSRAELPVLCSRSSLAIYLTHSNVYVNPNLPTHPIPPSLPMSTRLHLYSCPGNRFICTIFLESKYALIDDFLSFWLTSLYMTDSMSYPHLYKWPGFSSFYDFLLFMNGLW